MSTRLTLVGLKKRLKPGTQLRQTIRGGALSDRTVEVKTVTGSAVVFTDNSAALFPKGPGLKEAENGFAFLKEDGTINNLFEWTEDA